MAGSTKGDAEAPMEASPPPAAGEAGTGGAGKGKRVGAPPGAALPPPAEAAGPSGQASEKTGVLPLDTGTLVDCKWRDDEFYTARVIERRVAAEFVPSGAGGGSGEPMDADASGPGAAAAAVAAKKAAASAPLDPAIPVTGYEYYVHYLKFNRRMDEWVNAGAMDLSTVDTTDVKGANGGGGAGGAAGAAGAAARKRAAGAGGDDHADEDHAEFDAHALREHEEFTKVKNVERIELGRYEMETWYFSPLPPEAAAAKKLYFAEFDLAFFTRRDQMLDHLRKTRLQHPPGDEIYRKGAVSMFEVDGKKEKTYCQNLCYLAKLFLDHKTLYYDVDLFLFYVLCECDARGAHIVGYFSKEKHSEEGYNLACILTLPPYQRKGYGKFLISMSYELSKIEGKVGTPERPLSDLGNVSYRGYWTRALLGVLKDHDESISIKELSDMTAIKTDDVISTLQHLGLIQYQKGQHVICAAPKVIEKHLKAAGSAGLAVDPSRIIWTKFDAEKEYSMYRP